MDRPAMIGPDYTSELLLAMRAKIAKEFGVTLQQDVNGAWGPMGARYLTLRFRHGGDDIEISTVIQSVRSGNEDKVVEYEEAHPK